MRSVRGRTPLLASGLTALLKQLPTFGGLQVMPKISFQMMQ